MHAQSLEGSRVLDRIDLIGSRSDRHITTVPTSFKNMEYAICNGRGSILG